MKKKLIEVAMPLEAINLASIREKSIRRGHPSTLHLWWARRPLAAARAVLFASLVDDPSARPAEFPDEEAQSAERNRLFKLIEGLVVWENSNDKRLLALARAEIEKSCGPKAPEFFDPFAGGGAIPLEAQRLGLKVKASDLNPVAVAINKAMVEIPPKFRELPPINPSRSRAAEVEMGAGAFGLAADVAYYAEVLRKKAFEKVGPIYPSVKSPGASGDESESTVLAWLWARTVKCPNPVCGALTPLARSFTLAKKKGSEIFALPVLENGQVAFRIESGEPKIKGTVSRRGAHCVVCGSQIGLPRIREEGRSQRLGSVLMAIVAKTPNGRVYWPANQLHLNAASGPRVSLPFDQSLPRDPLNFKTPNYGLANYSDLFTSRQLIFLIALTDLLIELRAEIESDAIAAGLSSKGPGESGFSPKGPGAGLGGHEPSQLDLGLAEGGTGAKAYSQAVVVYLSFIIDKLADYHSTLCSWIPSLEAVRGSFARQALPMVWDYVEANPFSGGAGSFENMAAWVVGAIRELPANGQAVVAKADARSAIATNNLVISTDPPYYDNVSYARLSDYFYIWLRKSLGAIYKSDFSTILTPKNDELVADFYRFGRDKNKAKVFFEAGLKEVFANFYQALSPDFPLTVYYAFKQKEAAGWETMLSALIESGFAVVGTWPIKTERGNRIGAIAANALASSIVLVCRKRPKDAPLCSRRDFTRALRAELNPAIWRLREANIAPVDLAQAAIGPGMAVFSRYAGVLEPDGSFFSVRGALSLINEELDKCLSEREWGLDDDSRLCLALFSRAGFKALPYGEADVLARAKNASIQRLAEKKIALAQKGSVRLLGFQEVPKAIKPQEGGVWLLTHQLAAALRAGGRPACAEIALKVGRDDKLEEAKSLAYRLFDICESNKWALEAFEYNALVQAWPEIKALIAKLRRFAHKNYYPGG
ncbi:MAG: DUF1156 domain-containing protein [Deltaproteobacteria bacterium]|nr:DUF1156 domain-containing protein [Deltaproteobacteria bacterium]